VFDKTAGDGPSPAKAVQAPAAAWFWALNWYEISIKPTYLLRKKLLNK
jgi:hypothetical protein